MPRVHRAPAPVATPAPSQAAPNLDPRHPDNSEILERIAAARSGQPAVAAEEKTEEKKKGPGVNEAGLGVTVGDWNIGFKPALSTSDEHDDVGTRERAARQRQDAVVERRDRRPPREKKP